MKGTSRRDFLRASLCFGSLAAMGHGRVQAIDPIQRTGPAQMRLSLAAYSFRKYLDLKIKPRPPMSLFEFADLAAKMEVPAIEPTAYYFAETTPEYLSRLKQHCVSRGLAISGGAVGNNFCHADPAKLRGEVEAVKQWIDRYAVLGAKTLRIFAGTTPTGDTEEKARARCVEAIQESCDHAAKARIHLALENHGGITSTARQLLEIVRAVKHPWFGVNLDSGNFHSADPYEELAAIAPYAVAVQVKTEITRKGQKAEEADLPRLIGILRKVSYQGFVALEYEGAEDAKVAVPRYLPELKKLLA